MGVVHVSTEIYEYCIYQETEQLYVALYSDELTLEVIGLPNDEIAGSLRYTFRRETM